MAFHRTSSPGFFLEYIWVSQNQLIFENRDSTPTKTVGFTILSAREWEQAQSLVPHHLPKTIETLPYQVPEATINCYTDGSWRADQKHAGLRWVFIDGSGTTINKGSRFKIHVSSASIQLSAIILIECVRIIQCRN